VNYDQFCALWHEVLDEAGLLSFPPGPAETIDLGDMTRAFRIFVERYQQRRAGPFHITAELSWCWDALQTARTTTRVFRGTSVSSQNVGANPCGRPVGQAQGTAPTPNY